MNRLLYTKKIQDGKKIYIINTYQAYLLNLGILVLIVSFFFKNYYITLLGAIMVIFNMVSKLLATNTTKMLFRLQKEGKLTAKGSKYSFRDPLRFIEHEEKVY